MPTLSGNTVDVRVPHQLGRAEARERVKQGFTSAKGKAAGMATVDETWDGDRMNFTVSLMGQKLSGWADVEDDAVAVHVVLPMLLAKIAGGIKDKLRPMIEQKTRDALKLPPAGK